MDLKLTKKFEGFRAGPYKCPAGVATIGYGSTRYLDGRKVQMTDLPVTKEYAERMLEIDMLRRYIKIRPRVHGPMTAGEKAALTDFAYNLGCGALFGSTLFRKYMAGDKRGASREFRRWVYAGGRRLRGLVRRRAAEKRLYRQRP